MPSITKKRRPGTVSFVRFKFGLSQQQLADTLGISRSLIAMVETGKRKLCATPAAIYLEMCRKAEAMNPCGGIMIKRGRKSGGFQHSLPDSSFVTNNASPAKTSDKDIFFDRLQKKKASLSYLHTALQFRKTAAEERGRELSLKLICVDSIYEVSTKLLALLPEGKHREKQELRAAVFYAKQVKLKQQLKKSGPVAILQIEFQMNILERQIELAEKRIAKLINREADHLRIDAGCGIAA